VTIENSYGGMLHPNLHGDWRRRSAELVWRCYSGLSVGAPRCGWLAAPRDSVARGVLVILLQNNDFESKKTRC
jgi:hypothetical protein